MLGEEPFRSLHSIESQRHENSAGPELMGDGAGICARNSAE